MTDDGPPDALASSQVDRIMNVLSKRRRRTILHRLQQDDRLQPFQGSDPLDGAAIELRHVHLPKLEAAGYVEWNRETGAVTRGPRYDEIAAVLTLIEDHADECPGADDE